MKFLKIIFNSFKEIKYYLLCLAFFMTIGIFQIFYEIEMSDKNLTKNWNDCYIHTYFKNSILKRLGFSEDKHELCHIYQVPLDWNNPIKSEKINLFVKKYGENKPQKIYLLIAGGPGQTEKALENIAENIYKKEKFSNVILFDHRGTGHSNELKCKNMDVVECRKEFQKKHEKWIEYFNSYEAALDIKFILKDSPHVPVAVYGVSYGTYLERRLLDLNIDNVNTYIFDSVSAGKFSKKDEEKSVEKYFYYCNANKNCLKNINNSSYDVFINNYNHILNKKKCLSYKDKIQNNFNENELNFINSSFRRMLKFPTNLFIFNDFINGINSCDKSKIHDIIASINSANNNKIDAILLANITCNETIKYGEFPRNENYLKMCNQWFKYKFIDFKKNYFDYKNVNFLILNGDMDAVTPLRNATYLKELLPKENSKILIVKTGGHDPLGYDIDCQTNVIINFSNQHKIQNNKCLKDMYSNNNYTLELNKFITYVNYNKNNIYIHMQSHLKNLFNYKSNLTKIKE